MILVANGGLGSAYDELELNRGICEKYGIKVRGVVLNKVRVHVTCALVFMSRCQSIRPVSPKTKPLVDQSALTGKTSQPEIKP